MPNNDQLTRMERIRLECIAQANAFFTMKHGTTPSDVIEVATRFETFLLSADLKKD